MLILPPNSFARTCQEWPLSALKSVSLNPLLLASLRQMVSPALSGPRSFSSQLPSKSRHAHDILCAIVNIG
jgi:hypothetical protein